ncbi:hypothetical protein [Bradyrhizobium sp. NP1]|uniref:hypothetical protein n=1 Tax=Bradyrhizobium sp. NP1 TaxID=3049772 RepID=UPI0025A63023|nr:hypothetical protein [Bradyrhizobium sp. NP1]WJR81486.1 hypothetical protein QOU61_17595 [Bradyrhizobium sp. NP1]
MGLLGDIRSGKRGAAGFGGDAIAFWLLAGLVTAGVVASYGFGSSEKLALLLAVLGVGVGLCLGLYAAFGATRLARILMLPGLLIALLH